MKVWRPAGKVRLQGVVHSIPEVSNRAVAPVGEVVSAKLPSEGAAGTLDAVSAGGDAAGCASGMAAAGGGGAGSTAVGCAGGEGCDCAAGFCVATKMTMPITATVAALSSTLRSAWLGSG